MLPSARPEMTSCRATATNCFNRCLTPISEVEKERVERRVAIREHGLLLDDAQALAVAAQAVEVVAGEDARERLGKRRPVLEHEEHRAHAELALRRVLALDRDVRHLAHVSIE